MSFITSTLDRVEKIGNKLPHPVVIFMMLTLVVMIFSAIGAAAGWEVSFYDAKSKADVTKEAVNFLSGEGMATILSNTVTWFTSFAPFGVVLVAMLGVGISERTGLLGALIEKGVTKSPKAIVSYVVVFIGIMSNITSDAGYVVLIPLGAVIFIGFGRHPLAGMAAAFAGVSGGFSANLLFGSIDALLSGISNEVLGAEEVGLLSNWFFLIASTFLITAIGGLITDKIVEPRLGTWKGTYSPDVEGSTGDESRGLKVAGIAFLIFALIVTWWILPIEDTFGAGSLLVPLEVAEASDMSYMDRLLGFTAPFYKSLIILIALGFAIPGIAYGVSVGTVKSSKDVVDKMTQSMSSMGGYIVLSFFAAIFINVFNLTNLGTILAFNGAEFLRSLGLDDVPVILLIAFIFISAFINLFIGSASAKWGIVAPIFLIMFKDLGIDPAWTQLAYRIGDSSTNIISPLMSYFAIIVVFASKYDVEGEEPAGIGTIMSMMLPYSIIFILSWTLLFAVWYLLGLPIGI